MAEIIRYRYQNVKLGTFECLYYASYPKYKAAFDMGHLQGLEGKLPPEEYLNLSQGFMFRFPFPDEDKLSLGKIIEPYNREIPITLSKAVFDKMQGGDHKPEQCQMSIAFQKPVLRRSDGNLCHALIIRDGATGGLYRMEDDLAAKLLVREIVKHHISKESDSAIRSFYRHIAARILKGYKIGQPAKSLQQVNKIADARLPPSIKKEDKVAENKANEIIEKKKKRIRIGKRG